jgi:PRTRC genetic system protein A
VSIDPRDAALQATCPAVAVPRFGALSPAPPGQRVLLARNGTFLEVTRSWLRFVFKLGDLPVKPPLPYGDVQEHLSFAFGVIPLRLLGEFIAHGRRALPNETAGALVFSKTRGALRLVIHEALQSGPAAIHYRIDRMEADEELAVDLHTHGALGACWSSTDDADDQGVKVCGVFGNLDHVRPSAAFRLAVNGRFIKLPHPWDRRGPLQEVVMQDRCPTLTSMGFEAHSQWNI